MQRAKILFGMKKAQNDREERRTRWQSPAEKKVRNKVNLLSNTELKEELKGFGLNTEGDIETLRTRLFEHIIFNQDEDEDEDEDEDNGEEEQNHSVSERDDVGLQHRLETLRRIIRKMPGGKSRRRIRHHRRKTHKHKRGKKSHKRKHNKTSRKRHKSRKHRYHR